MHADPRDDARTKVGNENEERKVDNNLIGTRKEGMEEGRGTSD